MAMDEPPKGWNPNYGVVGSGDRRLAFSRQLSSSMPRLARSDSSISMPPPPLAPTGAITFRWLATRPMRRLALLIALNVAYSATELAIGLLTARVGLVSDAFHLTFGCGILTFSLFAMAASRTKPDHLYTYGYKRLEVLAAFTNALATKLKINAVVMGKIAYLRKLGNQHNSRELNGVPDLKTQSCVKLKKCSDCRFSAMQPCELYKSKSSCRHYLIVSAVTNLLVNLLGVWFFRSYARVNIVYRKAEDMNYHSVCLHVLADSVRRVENAEVLCLGIVSVAVFMLVLPLFKATGNILLQIAPGNVPPSALTKCFRQISACEDVSEVCQGRFWELVPGHAVGSLDIRIWAYRT
uniref:Cation efflux protein transmembrane domain-containing protein n=1 Tax=Oryza nivara TaxID=4536 RepID=A0A0E0GFD8_ORYNI